MQIRIYYEPIFKHITFSDMSSDSWFESWFDSPLYEQLYANRDDAEAARLVDWVSGQFPPVDHSRILDLGCGRGRHSLLLASKGYEVTGVDLSLHAINKARQKAREANIQNVRFETGDMRSWRKSPFDLVCNLFTSFGYFDEDNDNLHVVSNIKANLKTGGYLVMDYLNPSYVRETLVPEETTELGELSCRIHRHIENGMVVKSLSFVSREDGRSVSFQERVKLYDLQWFETAFTAHDMNIARLCGDYSGGGFDSLKSTRMVMVVHLNE